MFNVNPISNHKESMIKNIHKRIQEENKKSKQKPKYQLNTKAIREDMSDKKKNETCSK